MLWHISVLYFLQMGVLAAWYGAALSLPFLMILAHGSFSLAPQSTVSAWWYGPTVRGLPASQHGHPVEMLGPKGLVHLGPGLELHCGS